MTVARRIGAPRRAQRVIGAAGVLILAMIGGCSKPQEPTGTFHVDLVAGGGESLTSSRAIERNLAVYRSTHNAQLDFAVATDGALWAAIAAPGDGEHWYSNEPATSVETLVRIAGDGTVRDVGFGFIDPEHLADASASDEVVIASGPVSDGDGGVAVVMGMDSRPGATRDSAWTGLYRVDARGQVSRVAVPEGYRAVGLGSSAAGGFLLHAVSLADSGCARVFGVGVDGDAVPVLGVECSDDVPEAFDLDVAGTAAVKPMELRLSRTDPASFRAGQLPDGRLVFADATLGLMAQLDSGLFVPVIGTPAPMTQDLWTVWTADEPFEVIGQRANEFNLGGIDFTVSPDGKVAVVLTDNGTPQLAARAFGFVVDGVAEGNHAQELADKAIHVSRSADDPAEGRVRGTGVAVIDLTNLRDELPQAQLVTGTGHLCDWRGTRELVCGVHGELRVGDAPGGSPQWGTTTAFFAVPVPAGAL